MRQCSFTTDTCQHLVNRKSHRLFVLTAHQQGATPLLDRILGGRVYSLQAVGLHHRAQHRAMMRLLQHTPMAGIFITDIESAINYWRARAPSPDHVVLPAPTRALAEVYALMVYHHATQVDESSMPPKALEAWLEWYASTPDTPCIAICSTSQGDALCKGCGRTFAEVQHWTEMGPAEKRATWHRITLEASAWRFNKYAERAAEGVSRGNAGVLSNS